MRARVPVRLLKLLGSKGAMEILLILENGPRYFNELAENVRIGTRLISQRTLNRRLKELEGARLVTRKVLRDRPPRTLYQLSKTGRRTLDKVLSLEE